MASLRYTGFSGSLMTIASLLKTFYAKNLDRQKRNIIAHHVTENNQCFEEYGFAYDWT